MSSVNSLVALGLAALCILSGCGGEAVVKTVPFSQAAPERRVAFAKALEKALKEFDDLYGKISVEISGDEGDGPAMSVKPAGSISVEGLETPLGVALTNISRHHPGIGFMLEGGGYRILMPAGMPVEETGEFRLGIP